MTVYLDADDLAAIARRTLPDGGTVRDHGLLASALARPQMQVFGVDPYPDLFAKAAALLHSLVANRSYVDGNKRVGLIATMLFLALDGHPVNGSDDDLFDLTMDVAAGLDDVPKIAAQLRALSV